jgi:hypothetical protein
MLLTLVEPRPCVNDIRKLCGCRNTYATGLILIGLSLVICAAGAYAGALARRIIGPPSRPVETLRGTDA